MPKRRKKISTTISPEGYAFLQSAIREGRAENLAQAIDLALEEVRRLDNRLRLEKATSAYYESASDEAIAEENNLAAELSSSTPGILFDE
jgi:hypothetical protein